MCHTPFPPLNGGSDPGDSTVQFTDSDAMRPTDAAAAPLDTTAPSHLAAGQRFANRYTIIRTLGAGGMGVVYHAWDHTLAAAVALKLIGVDGETGAKAVKRRDSVRQELRLARQVTHANVVRIHDLGEVGNTLYLTMEYIEGADLCTLLKCEGRLSVPRALALARQMAAGLAAAHTAGVVHRDLKPANIMVTDEGHTLLNDFGIARSAADASVPGAIAGTREYMSPEQARGEAADRRSDVYTFGLILYELLTGTRPVGSHDASPSEVLARVQQGPPPLRTVVPDIPADLEAVVNRCLERDPAARYDDAGQVSAALEQLDDEGCLLVLPGTVTVPPATRNWAAWKVVAAGTVAASILAGATVWIDKASVPVVSPAARAPVLVLVANFDNRTGDPVFQGSLEQTLGLAMEGAPFITAFSRGEAAAIAARHVRAGASLDEGAARLVANREGIRVILAGAIERTGSGYRLQVRALAPDRDDPIAVAQASASNKSTVLSAVDEVASHIRRALGDTATSTRQAGETFTASSLEAVRAYTIAQDLARKQREVEAIEHYREAITHDPKFGRAYAGWATTAYNLGRRQEAEEMWNIALGLMERMTERERLRTMGGYFVSITRNYPQAIDTFRQLVHLYPGDSAGHGNLAVAYFFTLDFPKALEEGRRGIEIQPRSLKFRSNYALYAMYASDFSSGAAAARDLLNEDATLDSPYLPLAADALAHGDLASARGIYDKAVSIGTGLAASLGSLGLADLAMYEGRYDDAARTLQSGADADRKAANVIGEAAKLVALAQAHAAAGRASEAHRVAAQALTLGDHESIRVPIGRLYISQKKRTDAQKIIEQLSKRLQPQSRAYAALLESEVALNGGDIAGAIALLDRARTLADLWLVRYSLGLAYLQAGDHAGAAREFDLCAKRRGEASAVFLDDFPSFRYLSHLPYWHARAQQALGQHDSARANYTQFLAVRGERVEESLVQDARARLAVLK
jgi:tetratricopeptide (TPR) repeat protein